MATEPDPSRYGRSFADVYDQWYDDEPTAGIVAFVGELLPSGGSVLELGVGTGRVALALADAGFEVTGLDASPEMLERLRAKPGSERVTAIEADAGDTSAYPVASADVVLAAFNLVFNLTSADVQRACFAGAASALRPGGRFVVEAFVPRPIEERRRDLVTRSVHHDRVVLIATDEDPDHQIVRGSHIEIGEAGTRLRPWTIRVCAPAELDAMAELASLVLVERLCEVGGSPFVEGESTTHVSVYGKAG